MSSANKRRLRKLAREYVRPGVHITDMYSRLVQIQQQRVLWQRYTTVAGTRPEVPLGIADVVVAFQSAYQDLDEARSGARVVGDADRMKNLSLGSSRHASPTSRASPRCCRTFQERTAIVERLRASHLEPARRSLVATRSI